MNIGGKVLAVVVTHAEGVDFLMEGARDNKNPNVDYASLVSALKARSVRFPGGPNRPVAGERAIRLHQAVASWRNSTQDAGDATVIGCW